jgi:hypothetical protein
VTQEQDFINPELTLAQLCIQLVLSQSLQYHPQMICMLCFALRIYQNVINEYHHKLIKIIEAPQILWDSNVIQLLVQEASKHIYTSDSSRST